MAVAGRAAIAQRLVARGWSPETPAAVLLGASSEGAFTWTGLLRDLGSAPLPPGTDLPGTLVVGAVAALGLSVARGSPEVVPDAAGAAGATP
jgi:siroheme synthase